MAGCISLGATAIFVLIHSPVGLDILTGIGLLVTSWAVCIAVARLVGRLGRDWMEKSPIRFAVISNGAPTELPWRDVSLLSSRYEFVGRIALPGEKVLAPPSLAQLDGLRDALIEHDIRLLVLSPEAPRRLVFDELVGRCLDLPFQLVELSSFYEEVFGYVPISEMNAFWFQYLVLPSYRTHRLAKRVIDVVGAGLLALLALPLCGTFALLIRRDGGPAVFRQTRIGEAGRPFTLYKLRTMQPSSGVAAQWAAIDDPRVTPIGRFLRRSHLDELPQLLNVMRGEMSLVGPRPEQPAVVERLEREVPFYQRRHLIRPGISGWAQIRCGYARSDSGSVWKHAHDLYYLKHRSIRLDISILAVTARLVLLGAIRQSEVIARPVQLVEPIDPVEGVMAERAPVAAGGGVPPGHP